MKEKLLGVLGGMGPMATAYFLKIVTDMTEAETDQQHIPMLICNHTTIPDRTAYILGESNENPVPALCNDAKFLEKSGADILAMTCNTAHNFYEQVQANIEIPLLHIVKETVEFIAKRNNNCKNNKNG